ncbi:MAG: cation:proton antiporter, partial [Bacilli bacterium]
MDNIGFTVLIYGCLILVALLMTRLTRLLHFPNVTAYLLGGLIIGPSLMLIIYRLFAGSGSAPTLFLSQYATAIGNLGIICDIALAFIALSIGGEFKTSEIKKMGKRIVIIGLFEALTATILVTGILLALHNVLNISVGICLTLGAIAAATAPAATLLVVKQYKAKGPVVSTLLPIVALDDAIGLIIFSISYSIAGVYELGVGISIFSVLVNPLVEILVSLGLGVLIGIVLTQMSKLFKSRANALGLMVGVALISVAIAKIN